MKNKTFIIIVVVILLVGIGGYFYLNRESYQIKLPVYNDLVSLNFERGSNGSLVGSEEAINDVYNILKKLSNSHKKSVNDTPKVSDYIKIVFNYSEVAATTVYAYKENSHYYIEQPYNGIYKITKDDFNKIESYL